MVDISSYFHQFSFSHILSPYLLASDDAISLHAKLVLAYVSSTLQDDEVEELMCLSPSNADGLLTTFGQASTDKDSKAGGFTLIELVQGLTKLLVCHGNLELIAKQSILPTVVTVLSSESVEEQRAICQLLWLMLNQPSFKAIANGDKFPVLELLEHLKKSDDNALQLLASCVLFEMKDTSIKGEVV